MDELGLKRYCCRRMIMTHVDLIEKLLKYDDTARRSFPEEQLLSYPQVHARWPKREEAAIERDRVEHPWEGATTGSCMVRRFGTSNKCRVGWRMEEFALNKVFLWSTRALISAANPCGCVTT
ncbi:hypothetical protein AUP68_03165 [Ilyonectria robusta]